eukprot:6211912-Pleurochrysis_carterae.AAC.2
MTQRCVQTCPNAPLTQNSALTTNTSSSPSATPSRTCRLCRRFSPSLRPRRTRHQQRTCRPCAVEAGAAELARNEWLLPPLVWGRRGEMSAGCPRAVTRSVRHRRERVRQRCNHGRRASAAQLPCFVSAARRCNEIAAKVRRESDHADLITLDVELLPSLFKLAPCSLRSKMYTSL